MIRGAVVLIDGKVRKTEGQYTPEEFGKITLWQMVNLFSVRRPVRMNYRDQFRERMRHQGASEFEIYQEWERREQQEREQRGKG